MPLKLSSIKIIGDYTISILKGYKPTIDDEICSEISAYAKDLNLSCTRYLKGTTCFFNYDQCEDILTKEDLAIFLIGIPSIYSLL